ncbi:MAG: hypothetical protein DMG40_23285 [Acidobacteria bacterium]|nr:MAG: hypothetical protein DMG40_23285 [Acidobacteriota bacterium]
MDKGGKGGKGLGGGSTSGIKLGAMRFASGPLSILIFLLPPPARGAQRAPAASPSQGVTNPESRGSRLFSAAEYLLQRGSVQQAHEKVDEGLKLDPFNAQGYNLLGLIYQAEHRYALAATAFQRAQKIAPDSVEILSNLGNVYFLEKKFEPAENEFRHALRLQPANRDANYSLGLVLLREHRAEEAIQYFQAVEPADTRSLFNLVQAYFQAKQTERGLKTAEQLSGMAKNDVRVHFTLGVALAANKQYAAGVRELEAADAIQPGTFEILHNLGQAYLQNGQIERAQAALSRALRLRPKSVPTLFLLAETYQNQHEDLNALELLTQAHKLSPKNTDVIFLLARLMMTQAYYEDAIPLLESGVKTAPTRPDLHAALGECYFSDGKVQKAILEFEKLLKFEPSAGSYAFLALCYRHLGQFDQAKKYLSEGLKSDPRNPGCLYNMGYIASREGHLEEAEAWLGQAVAADPNYVDALLELSNIKMQEGKYRDAVPLLERCAQLEPRRAPVYYKLATAERNLKEMEAAERDLKVFETLSRDPSPGPYPYQHLFDYLDKRAGLPPQEQSRFDLAQLQEEAKRHPGRPRDLYLLAEAYLKLGRADAAEQTIGQLDQISQGDFRTAVGVGVLLARYGLYAQAIAHFQAALQADPHSSDAAYDLADAYFRAHDYQHALAAIQHISTNEQQDPAYLSLLGDIEAHLGRTEEAVRSFRQAIAKSPYNDVNYLSLAMTYLRSGNTALAREVLGEGLSRTPDSGRLFWGKGVLVATEGNPEEAEKYLEKAVELLPQWAGSYSALGVLYFKTGQIEKAKEVLKKFTRNGPQGALDVQNIDRLLSAASQKESAAGNPIALSPQARQEFLAMALSLTDDVP